MWPLSNITSAQNRSALPSTHHHHHPQQQQRHQMRQPPHRLNNIITTNPLFCQAVVGCVDPRSQSPTTLTKRNVHCFNNNAAAGGSESMTTTSDSEDVELIYSYRLQKNPNHHSTNYHNHNSRDTRNSNIYSSSSTRNSSSSSSSSKKLKSNTTTATPSSSLITPTTARMKKGIIKVYDNYGNIDAINTLRKKSNSSSHRKKTVSFDLIEVREHPRILGDNPSAKKGPPLSIGWYEPSDGRILRYSVDEYERRRNESNSGNGPNHREKKRSVEIVSPTERQRMLLQDVGVSPSEIFAARKEVSKIRKSRRDHNVLVNYDETVVVLEHCLNTVQRLLSYNGTSKSECEFQALMEQTERSKQQQQQKLLIQQQQQQQQRQQHQQRLYEKMSRQQPLPSSSRTYQQHLPVQ